MFCLILIQLNLIYRENTFIHMAVQMLKCLCANNRIINVFM